jgi:hypothetical protein
LGTLTFYCNFWADEKKRKKGYMLLKFQNSCKIEVYEISCPNMPKLLGKTKKLNWEEKKEKKGL